MPLFDDPRLTAPAGASTRYQVTAGVAAIRATPCPDGEMVTQALHGERVRVFREDGAFAQVQLEHDRYTGWALMDALSAPHIETTHRVHALRTYAFSEPDLKSAPRFLISLNSQVAVEGAENGFAKCARAGWVFEGHLSPGDVFESDPASVAERFAGTPYLWGGRESLGLDCTGLTCAAFAACGLTLPRDSDMQLAWCGTPVDDWQGAAMLQRGDLVFWKGHVAIMLDDSRLIHSNAFHMATAIEPLDSAIRRIAPRYGDPVGVRRIAIDEEAARRPGWLAGPGG
jgi:hypothetical protein